MPKIDAATYERAYTRAVAYARGRMRGRPWAESDSAEDLAQEALLASFDPRRYPWKGDKALEHHVVNVVRSILSDRRRAAKLRADPERAAAVDHSMKRTAMPADASARAADRAARHEERHRWMLSRLDGLARDVYLLYARDIFEAAAQATVLDKPMPAIYAARRTVAEVARATPAEQDSDPELASTAGDGPPSDDGSARA